ncbi:MAG: penicillin-binding protein 1C [Saprospiraceae bacterium]
MAFFLILLLILLIPIPDYTPAYSRALYSEEGHLLAANVSTEHQWHLPNENPIPEKLELCIRYYEDEYFYYHLGVNPISLIKAIIKNTKEKSVVRGASTIPMQVMRMKNRNVQRNYKNKIFEIAAAVKYSIITSKPAILREWANMAPFGGNTIGAETAALRYYGRSLDKLSLAEYALLAILPNNPSNIHLAKNRTSLKLKRDFLITKLFKKGQISDSEMQNSLSEELPDAMYDIPKTGHHFLQFVSKEHPGRYLFQSTIQSEIQHSLQSTLLQEAIHLRQNGIDNVSAIIVDVEKNTLLAYLGNIPDPNGRFAYVDIAQSPRSYGSLLKPMLYAYALEQGYFLPHEMIADIPTYIGDFQPMNFDKKFRGAVPISDMVTQSLNVPAVRILNTIGMQEFYQFLTPLHLNYLNKGIDHYGLSFILGGGETTLWDLSKMYKGLAQSSLQYPNPFGNIQSLKNEKSSEVDLKISSATMQYVNEAMSNLSRPREEKFWDLYTSDEKIAWKTGTSFGHKDAWAIGYNAKFMVAVWVGNASGEGRPNLTGITKAAPIMFKLFRQLQSSKWFQYAPIYPRYSIRICKNSGKLSGTLCNHTSSAKMESAVHKLTTCNYHEDVMLDKNDFLITPGCTAILAKRDTFFILPPHMEYYYRKVDKSYQILPDASPECKENSYSIQILYPTHEIKIFLPIEREHKPNTLIFKAYHPRENSSIFWYLDDIFMGETRQKNTHEIHANIEKGKHILTVIDEMGNRSHVEFEVI